MHTPHQPTAHHDTWSRDMLRMAGAAGVLVLAEPEGEPGREREGRQGAERLVGPEPRHHVRDGVGHLEAQPSGEITA